MALYDGFFDAEQDEETGEYDRGYGPSDFTGYFANLIGSGVCVHGNPDSFLVRLEDGKAVVGPGYLFIQGYWLKNDADYSVDLPGAGNYAIVAHLNLGKRLIEVEARSVAQAYPDSLVLAVVSPTSAEDTRHNTDICGTIDTAGELSQKVEWAINYIDNEIEDKLKAAEDTILAQERRLDAKIAEVQAVADSIVPPPVGSIKFSASQDVGEEWLKCDGRFVNEADYPELVAALGKLTPSGDKFQLISSGEIGPQISNGVVYDGRLWVYSYSTKKLYGVDLTGDGTIKEIAVSSEDSGFLNFEAPSTPKPLCLSIAPNLTGGTAKIFLSQIIKNRFFNSGLSVQAAEFCESLLMYGSDFTGEETAISLSVPFQTVTIEASGGATIHASICAPYVVSSIEKGIEKYHCAVGATTLNNKLSILDWAEGETASVAQSVACSAQGTTGYSHFSFQRVAHTRKNRGEAVSVYSGRANTNNSFSTESNSSPTGLFLSPLVDIDYPPEVRTAVGPINIGGAGKVFSEFDTERCMWVSVDKAGAGVSSYGLSLPPSARVFVDAAAYLWGKDIYMIFVGTGIIFSRTLEEGSFGYLDTTSVLGTITQFGYLDYSQDEGTLYLLGQDTTNTVKVAKIVLNTLYDYANDGAWLPLIASDGVPAYIKAKGGEQIPDPVNMRVSVSSVSQYADILFNGEAFLVPGEYSRIVSNGGDFTVGIRRSTDVVGSGAVNLKLNGATIATVYLQDPKGTTKTVTLKTSDYIANGVTLSVQ